MISDRRSIDAGNLPDYAFGTKDTNWWGTVGFIAIEATTLGIAFVCYFYLRGVADAWPPPRVDRPELVIATVNLAVLCLSAFPMALVHRASEQLDYRRTMVPLVICDLLGIIFCVLRVSEFKAFHVLWNENAYGSVVWMALGVHTFHIVTEVIETIVLTLLLAVGYRHPKYFSDISDNCYFWYFVVIGWIFGYAILFLSPRVSL